MGVGGGVKDKVGDNPNSNAPHDFLWVGNDGERTDGRTVGGGGGAAMVERLRLADC